MNKKLKFSDKPLSVKIVYIVTIAILVICAVVVTVVSVASRKESKPDVIKPPVEDNLPEEDPKEDEKPGEVAPTFYSPVTGTVSKEHSADTPVFSETLKEWKVHSGIDIVTEESAPVYAAADGVISAIYDDPFLGRTVEVSHSLNHKTVYSNLVKEDAAFISVGDKVALGDRIGTVGYSAIFEIAEEPHLHFEMKKDGKAIDPLKNISEESKKDSLGIGKNE